MMHPTRILISALLSTCVAILSTHTRAATFVGNGGSFAEKQLRISVNALEDVLRSAEDVETKCECLVASDYDTCQIVDDLDDDQITKIESFISQKAKKMLRKLRKAKFKFTDANLVHQAYLSKRNVSAGTKGRRVILINEDQFLEANPANRVSILFHELSHLVTNDEKKPIFDEKPFGGFEEGKDFLDSAGSCVAQMGLYDKYIISQSVWESQPKAWLKHWFELSFQNGFYNEDKKVGKLNSVSGGGFSYRYQPSWYGFALRTGSYLGSDTSNSITHDHYLSFESLSASFRWSPFFTDSARLNNIYFLGEAGIANTHFRSTISDSFVKLTNASDSQTPTMRAGVFIPLHKSLWVGYIFSTMILEAELPDTLESYNGTINSQGLSLSLSF